MSTMHGNAMIFKLMLHGKELAEERQLRDNMLKLHRVSSFGNITDYTFSLDELGISFELEFFHLKVQPVLNADEFSVI